MFHHIVLLELADDAPPERAAEIVTALRALPDRIPEIRSYEVHADLGDNPTNADVSVHGTFDDETAWRTYTDHPEHQAVLRGLIVSALARATRTQFIDDETGGRP